ncbi:MAG: hypothetical protein HYY84_12630 [Deltaproteobacteria bacterium]|nr:hypothetical protein [Deltaproteobacteria bacterium]
MTRSNRVGSVGVSFLLVGMLVATVVGCKKDAPPVQPDLRAQATPPAARTDEAKRLSGATDPATPGDPAARPIGPEGAGTPPATPPPATPPVPEPTAPTGSATAALYKFVKASANNDFKVLKTLVTKESVKLIEMAESAQASRPTPNPKKDEPLPTDVVEKLEGNRATLSFTEPAKAGAKAKKGKVVFVREEGAWRFDFQATMSAAMSDPSFGAEDGATPLKEKPCAKKADASTPKKAMDALVAAAKAEDLGCLRLYFSKSSQNFIDASRRSGKKDVFRIGKTPIAGATEKISGDSAVVSVKEGPVDQSLHFVKEGSAWKLDFMKTVEEGLKKMQEMMKKMPKMDFGARKGDLGPAPSHP